MPMQDTEWTILNSAGALTAFIESARQSDWAEATLVWQEGRVTCVAGQLVHDMAMYPFLDMPRQWSRLGVPRWQVRAFYEALVAGWPIGCGQRQPRETVRKALA